MPSTRSQYKNLANVEVTRRPATRSQCVILEQPLDKIRKPRKILPKCNTAEEQGRSLDDDVEFGKNEETKKMPMSRHSARYLKKKDIYPERIRNLTRELNECHDVTEYYNKLTNILNVIEEIIEGHLEEKLKKHFKECELNYESSIISLTKTIWLKLVESDALSGKRTIDELKKMYPNNEDFMRCLNSRILLKQKANKSMEKICDIFNKLKIDIVWRRQLGNVYVIDSFRYKCY
jgi:hypothetical protein